MDVKIPPVEVLLAVTLDQATQIMELRQDIEVIGQRNIEQGRVIAELTGAQPSPLEHADASLVATPDGSDENPNPE